MIDDDHLKLRAQFDSSKQSCLNAEMFNFLIRFAGFNAVAVANNHFNDFGGVGSNFTVSVLQDAGMKYFGVSYGPYDSSQVINALI